MIRDVVQKTTDQLEAVFKDVKAHAPSITLPSDTSTTAGCHDGGVGGEDKNNHGSQSPESRFERK